MVIWPLTQTVNQFEEEKVMTPPLWVAMSVGIMLCLGGTFLPVVPNRKTAMSLGAALIVLVILGPNSIKNFEAIGIKVERYQPTKEDKDLAINFAQDKPSLEIVKKTEKLITAAEQRSDERRSLEDYLVLATEKWRTKRYDEALRLVYAGLSLNPEDSLTQATFIHRKASIYEGLGMQDFAIEYYKEAIQLDPKFSWPHNNLGIIYDDQDKYTEAEAEYKEAIRLDPKFAHPHIGLGSLYRHQGKHAEAEAEYKEAIRLDPKYAFPHNGLGNLYKDQGKQVEAESAYKEAIRLDPKYAYPHNGLGNLYRHQGKHAEAEAEYKETIRLDPKYASPHIGLGSLYRHQGKYSEAEFEYKEAISLNPKFYYAHYNLGRLYLKQKNYVEAKKALEVSLQLNPTDKNSLELIEQLQ
jgi:tetratricopeptide (TPR) repeat protein